MSAPAIDAKWLIDEIEALGRFNVERSWEEDGTCDVWEEAVKDGEWVRWMDLKDILDDIKKSAELA